MENKKDLIERINFLISQTDKQKNSEKKTFKNLSEMLLERVVCDSSSISNLSDLNNNFRYNLKEISIKEYLTRKNKNLPNKEPMHNQIMNLGLEICLDTLFNESKESKIVKMDPFAIMVAEKYTQCFENEFILNYVHNISSKKDLKQLLVIDEYYSKLKDEPEQRAVKELIKNPFKFKSSKEAEEHITNFKKEYYGCRKESSKILTEIQNYSKLQIKSLKQKNNALNLLDQISSNLKRVNRLGLPEYDEKLNNAKSDLEGYLNNYFELIRSQKEIISKNLEKSNHYNVNFPEFGELNINDELNNYERLFGEFIRLKNAKVDSELEETKLNRKDLEKESSKSVELLKSYFDKIKNEILTEISSTKKKIKTLKGDTLTERNELEDLILSKENFVNFSKKYNVDLEDYDKVLQLAKDKIKRYDGIVENANNILGGTKGWIKFFKVENQDVTSDNYVNELIKNKQHINFFDDFLEKRELDEKIHPIINEALLLRVEMESLREQKIENFKEIYEGFVKKECSKKRNFKVKDIDDSILIKELSDKINDYNDKCSKLDLDNKSGNDLIKTLNKKIKEYEVDKNKKIKKIQLYEDENNDLISKIEEYSEKSIFDIEAIELFDKLIKTEDNYNEIKTFRKDRSLEEDINSYTETKHVLKEVFKDYTSRQRSKILSEFEIEVNKISHLNFELSQHWDEISNCNDIIKSILDSCKKVSYKEKFDLEDLIDDYEQISKDIENNIENGKLKFKDNEEFLEKSKTELNEYNMKNNNLIVDLSKRKEKKSFRKIDSEEFKNIVYKMYDSIDSIKSRTDIYKEDTELINHSFYSELNSIISTFEDYIISEVDIMIEDMNKENDKLIKNPDLKTLQGIKTLKSFNQSYRKVETSFDEIKRRFKKEKTENYINEKINKIKNTISNNRNIISEYNKFKDEKEEYLKSIDEGYKRIYSSKVNNDLINCIENINWYVNEFNSYLIKQNEESSLTKDDGLRDNLIKLNESRTKARTFVRGLKDVYQTKLKNEIDRLNSEYTSTKENAKWYSIITPKLISIKKMIKEYNTIQDKLSPRKD